MKSLVLKLLFLACVVLLMLHFLPNNTTSSTEVNNEIKVVASIYKPFVFYENGKLVGVDIDLLDMICRTNNLKYTIQIVPFQTVLTMLKEGKADIGIGAIYVTEDRKRFMNFTSSYFKTGLVYIVRTDTEIDNNISDKKIGVKRNATGETIARSLSKRFRNLEIVPFESTEESLDALIDGRVDIVLNDYINTIALMHDKYRGRLKIKRGFGELPVFITSDYIAIAINKQRPDLLRYFDNTLEEITNSGMMKRILERWPDIYSIPNYRKFIVYGLLTIISSIFLSISIFRYYKNRQFHKLMYQSEQRYRAITEHSPDAVITADSNGSIVLINKAVQNIFSYTEKDLIGKPITMLMPDTCKQEHIVGFNRFIKTGKPFLIGRTYETIGKRKNGSEFPVELSLSTWQVEHKRFFTAMVRDFTERKKTEERLIDSENRFRSVIESAPNPIVVHCNDGSIVLVNKRFTEITGYNLDDINTFEKFSEHAFPDPDYRNKMIEKYKKLFETTTPVEYGEDINITCSDGSMRIWNIQSSPIGNWNNKKSVICIARDVTEHRRLEEQFRQAQKLESIGRFTGGIAHDFNNYLTAIAGFSQIVLMQIDNNHPLRQYLETILNSTEKASSLTKQLLAFSRRQVMQPEIVNLNTIINDMIKLINRIIGEDIQLRLYLDPKLWNIKVDPVQIEQVIMNLISNARDAMHDGGVLTIQTANALLDEEYAKKHISVVPGEYVMIAIEDTGVGMTEDIKAHIFEPFFTTKEIGKGTGLGLATVYGIVKQSSGNIWVYSEQGHGTTFKIYFPKIAEETTSYTIVEKNNVIPHGKETLLVVEDNKEVRGFILTVLKNIGYKVFEAQDGIEALSILTEKKGKIDMIITDVVMPNLSGDKLAARIKDLYSNIKILYMSGYSDNIITEKGILKEGINYLQKPLNAVTLAQTVRRVLDS